MTARRLVENCVLTNQTAVVDEMLNKHLLPEEGYHRRIRLLLVGQVSKRTGCLYGRRDTEDCR